MADHKLLSDDLELEVGPEPRAVWPKRVPMDSHIEDEKLTRRSAQLWAATRMQCQQPSAATLWTMLGPHSPR